MKKMRGEDVVTFDLSDSAGASEKIQVSLVKAENGACIVIQKMSAFAHLRLIVGRSGDLYIDVGGK